MSDKAAGLRSIGLPLGLAAAAMIAGFVAIYVTLGRPDNGARAPLPGVTQASTPAGAGSKLSVGEMTTFVFKKQPEALAEVGFKTRAGADVSLASWKGRVVLLNLWATWCAPCRKEMPGLDRLQAALGSNDFEVVALAVDRAGSEAAGKFLEQVEARSLALYVDATARGATALKAIGMPTTLLIDRQGREIGRLTGPAEWDSPEARRLVQSLF